MKKYLLILTTILISSMSLMGSARALSNTISLNQAYPKTGGTYDVVVKEKPGDKLALYVDDKNPVYATVNKKGWATFHKTKLTGTGKLSFTHVYGSAKIQKPINYVRYFELSGNNVSFLINDPTKAASATPATTSTASTPPPTTVQPTCTNGTYVNSAGNTVCSPEAAPSAPAGATAQCVDGTYSFSQSRSGTCSHHGGVGTWL